MADTTTKTETVKSPRGEMIVKFFSGNIEQSDAMLRALGGVQERVVRSQTVDKEVEAAHQDMMQKRGLEPVRAGRADTGDQVFGPNGLQNVSLAQFVADLVKNGHKVVQTKRERKPMRDRNTGEILSGKFRYIVEVHFSSNADAAPLANAAETARKLAAFCEDKFAQICHVWSNGGGHFTVNCTGGFQQGKPKVVNQLRFDGKNVFKTV